MAHEKELESFCIEIPAKADYHRFLIGKKGSNVQKVQIPYISHYIEYQSTLNLHSTIE